MVSKYCKAHPKLKVALKLLLVLEPEPEPKLKLEPPSERAPGKGNTLPALHVADYKQTILNTMHRVVETPAPAKKV